MSARINHRPYILLPPASVFPAAAESVSGAVNVIASFLSGTPRDHVRGAGHGTVVLTGAGVSVASGLSDYRGEDGTYRRNASYRPIYFHEFAAQHAARRRYWCRSFLGWPVMSKATPNKLHVTIAKLAEKKGLVKSVITQNVDSLHHKADAHLPIVELHGYLRAVKCINCGTEVPRDDFQQRLAQLNPRWAEFLSDAVNGGSFDPTTEKLDEKRLNLKLKINADGDADVSALGLSYDSFRYPACPHCLEHPPTVTPYSRSAMQGVVEVGKDGEWDAQRSNAGIFKPAVVMFGESLDVNVKLAAEKAIDDAARLLVLGSSLATLSAWRLVDRARARGMDIAIINFGGVRNEQLLLEDYQRGDVGGRVRCNQRAEDIIPPVARMLLDASQ